MLKKLKSLDEIRAANVRKPKAEVYQAIYDDCKWVIESSNLPEIQSKAGCGRTGKVAARALYAKALLQQATDGDFASQKKTLSDQAVTLLKDALSKAPFTDFTTVDVSEIWNVASQTSAQERIFQLNYVGGSASANSSYNTMFRPEKINDAENGEVNATKAAGSFFMGYQKTLDLYDEEGDLRMERLIALGTESSLPIYYTLKYKDLDKSGYYGCDCIVFRFADVVAMLAEANYHAGNNGEAVKYINMIRKRAGLSDTSASSGTALRDVIYKERQREFAYEFKAWNDMKRGYTKQEIFDIMKADGAAMYGDEDYLLPIPSVQQKLNPQGLPQNPGY